MLGRRRSKADPRQPTVALAGAGAIATVHALAAPTAGCRIVAVASAGGTSARHLAGQLDDRHRHAVRAVTIDELPAGADLLVVASPPDTHAALALAGLAAGADVLVEKPFTTTLAEADRLVVAAGTAGLSDDPHSSPPVLRCAENLLHAPAWAALTSHRERMGPLQHLSARTLQPPPTWGHFTRPLTAGGVVLDLGPHPIALVMEIAGEPVAAVAASLRSTRDDGADDDATLRIRFASGMTASMDVSWTNSDVEWSLQAASADGVARLELFPDVLVELDGEPVAVADRYPGAADPALERMGYIDQLVDTVAAADGRSAPGQSAEAARDVLEVICAAYASAGSAASDDELGPEVPVPFDGDRSLTPQQLWRR